MKKQKVSSNAYCAMNQNGIVFGIGAKKNLMTCGNLTYVRAKDAISISSEEIVDTYRMP